MTAQRMETLPYCDYIHWRLFPNEYVQRIHIALSERACVCVCMSVDVCLCIQMEKMLRITVGHHRTALPTLYSRQNSNCITSRLPTMNVIVRIGAGWILNPSPLKSKYVIEQRMSDSERGKSLVIVFSVQFSRCPYNATCAFAYCCQPPAINCYLSFGNDGALARWLQCFVFRND